MVRMSKCFILSEEQNYGKEWNRDEKRTYFIIVSFRRNSFRSRGSRENNGKKIEQGGEDVRKTSGVVFDDEPVGQDKAERD